MTGANRDWSEAVSGRDMLEGDKEAQVDILIAFQEMARSGRFDDADAILAAATLDDLGGTTIMILLRGTFAFRGRLRTWVPLRDAASASFHSRGMEHDDVKRLFFGLFEAGHCMHLAKLGPRP